MTKRRDTYVRHTPNGLHKYTCTRRAQGVYGWGDTPAAARAKLAEMEAKFAASAADVHPPVSVLRKLGFGAAVPK
jgi:hypothetical protein